MGERDRSTKLDFDVQVAIVLEGAAWRTSGPSRPLRKRWGCLGSPDPGFTPCGDHQQGDFRADHKGVAVLPGLEVRRPPLDLMPCLRAAAYEDGQEL